MKTSTVYQIYEFNHPESFGYASDQIFVNIKDAQNYKRLREELAKQNGQKIEFTIVSKTLWE